MAVIDPVQRLERAGRHLLEEGAIQDFLVRYDRASPFEDRLAIRVRYHDGGYQEFYFTTHEYRMGGNVAIDEWIRFIVRDVQRHANDMLRDSSRYVVGLDFGHNDQTVLFQRHTHSDPPIMPRFNGFSDPPCGFDCVADITAEQLFRDVAGKEHHKNLITRGWTPINGNAGGKYQLHKRAAYCVERPGDGARLCAVVPGVPLWDHLLGIKLMIEHDEKAFLAIANVSGGSQRSIFRGGALI